MSPLSKSIRRSLSACALAAAALVPTLSSAAPIQLGFILDRSGSIGSGNWTTIVNGLSNAVNTLLPTNSSYEVSVVSFASTASIDVNSFLVTDAASRTALAALIAGISFSGGGTNFAPAFNLMTTALTDAVGMNGGGTTAANSAASYVNFATDGVQGDAAAGLVARNALIAAGIDNISIEGIGSGVDANDLRTNYCFPGPCDDTAPYNFPAQGFYIGVADAAAYAAAIGNKIQVVTGQVPEPGSVALLGLALSAMVLVKRRRSV
jgi:von Willebrand factor type A domain/PEP-CTERM motif